MRAFRSSLALAAVLAAACNAQADAQTSPAAPTHSSCFFVNQFYNWKAPDSRTIIIRVNMSRYFRLDLAGTCPGVTYPDSHLIMNVHGPDTICSAVDWDLKVNQMNGIPTPCIVKTMTEMTPAEIAAIPKKFRP
jgi:hypothetical protein